MFLVKEKWRKKESAKLEAEIRELEKEWEILDNLICNSKWRYSEGLIPDRIAIKKIRILKYGQVTLRRRMYRYRPEYGKGYRYLLDEYLGFKPRMRFHDEVKALIAEYLSKETMGKTVTLLLEKSYNVKIGRQTKIWRIEGKRNSRINGRSEKIHVHYKTLNSK